MSRDSNKVCRFASGTKAVSSLGCDHENEWQRRLPIISRLLWYDGPCTKAKSARRTENEGGCVPATTRAYKELQFVNRPFLFSLSRIGLILEIRSCRMGSQLQRKSGGALAVGLALAAASINDVHLDALAHPLVPGTWRAHYALLNHPSSSPLCLSRTVHTISILYKV